MRLQFEGKKKKREDAGKRSMGAACFSHGYINIKKKGKGGCGGRGGVKEGNNIPFFITRTSRL